MKDHCISPFFSSTAKAVQESYFHAALTSTQVYDHTAYNSTLVAGMDPEKLKDLLWFFRTEDRKSR